MRTFAGLLALAALAASITLLVVIARDMARDRRDDAMFEPARRRRRIVLRAMLFTVLFPSIGTGAGMRGFVAGLALAGMLWIHTLLLLRRLQRLP